jgi:hypothetical protein
VIIPVVAQTGSFTSEIEIHAPDSASGSLSITFHEALGSATPGPRSCLPLFLSAGTVASFTLGAQCALPAGSRFGLLAITDAASPKTRRLLAYSRTSNPQGQGFSVEGFPIGVFSGARGEVTGLRRTAASPVYQTNCFVASLSEPLQYEIRLRANPGGEPIGTPITGSLDSWQMLRILDVFGPQGANAPAGDYTNVTAEFRQAPAGNAALVGFCTVQDSTSFGADFRIAKNVYADDRTRYRSLAYAHDGAGNLLAPVQILAAGEKNLHVFNIRPPDRVQCNVVGPNAGVLEMRAAKVDGTVLGGGNDASSAVIDTGFRGDYGGTAPLIRLEVGVRESAAPAYPVAYGLSCTSGNGIGWPWWWRRASDDF